MIERAPESAVAFLFVIPVGNLLVLLSLPLLLLLFSGVAAASVLMLFLRSRFCADAGNAQLHIVYRNLHSACSISVGVMYP